MADDWKNVTWTPDELITDDKLNDMVSRDNWLKSRIVPVEFQSNVNRSTGLKIISGVTVMPGRPNENRGNWVTIDFQSKFSPGCRPVVVASLSVADHYDTFMVLNGHAGNGVKVIDHNGFRVRIVSGNPDSPAFATSRYVHWIAVGY